MDTPHAGSQRIYDHRLRDLLRTVGDPNVVAGRGVPRSTASMANRLLGFAVSLRQSFFLRDRVWNSVVIRYAPYI
jgi:hypothetical protein